MPYGFYISAEGAQVQSRRMEVISNNLANVDTPGFKRDLAIFQARFAEAIQQGEAVPGAGGVDDVGGGVLLRGTKTDFSPGPLERTGLATDLAIDGDGFFLVRKGNQEFLTRAGNFRLTSVGELVTQDGYSVLGEDGEPILIDPTLGPWSFTPDGMLQQAGASTALAMVRPQSLGDLAKVGENLFEPLADVRPLEPSERHLALGYLEKSTVRATAEMMEMIEASRAFEANVALIRHQDAVIGTLLSRALRA